MKSKRFSVSVWLVVSLVIIASLLMFGCSSPSPTTSAPAPVTTTASSPAPATTAAPAAKPIEIKWGFGQTGVNPKASGYQVMKKWTEEVEKATNGRVKFIQLVGAITNEGAYDAIVNKICDIASNVVQFNTGRFPVAEMMTIPDLFTVCMRPSAAADEFYKTTPEVQKEFSQVKMICLHAPRPSPPGIGFGTRTKPVPTLEAAKGMKMGMFGAWGTKTVAALGFVPVSVPVYQVYESLQKGVVDGSFCDPEMLDSQKVAEVVKYWHSVGIMFSPVWFAMNINTWNSLPPDIQKIMDEQAANIPYWLDTQLDTSIKEIFKNHPEVTVVEYSDAEKARWKAAQDPVQAEYFAQLTAKGIDGQKIFDHLNDLYAKFAASK